MSKKKMTLTKAKKECWKVFSLYIRLKYASANGLVQCVTCKAIKPVKKMQAGHFIPGRKNSYLFEEKCVHPQCVQCNINKNGNWVEYLRFMKETYGEKITNDIINLKWEIKNYKVEEVLELKDYYENKVKGLSWKNNQ